MVTNMWTTLQLEGYPINHQDLPTLITKQLKSQCWKELDLGDDATIIDVMEWMINTQLGRRNLPPQQRIAVVKKFEKKIKEQEKKINLKQVKNMGMVKIALLQMERS